MSDKFLGTSGANINISNGSVSIFGSSIGALNLDPSQPVKTNSVRQLVSTKLDIADITSLQSTLDTKIGNPLVGTFQSDVIKTPLINNVAATNSITMGDNDINIVSDSLYFNGLKVSTGSSGVGGQNLFFNKSTASDIATYFELGTNLTSTGELTTIYSLNATSGTPQLLDTFITPSGFPNTTTISQGLSLLGMFAYVDSPTGDTSISFKIYSRSTSGTETLIVTSSESVDINTISSLTPYQTSLSLAIPNTTIASTDRLVIKLYGTKTTADDKLLYIFYEGNSSYSFFRSTFTGLEPYVASSSSNPANESISVFDTTTGKLIKASTSTLSSSLMTLRGNLIVENDLGTSTKCPITTQTGTTLESFASSYGWEFSCSSEIRITHFDMSDLQWLSSTTTKDAALYRESDSLVMGSITMNKDNLSDGIYTTELTTPISLARGTNYVFAAFKHADDKHENITNTFPSQIAGVTGRSNTVEGSLSMPTVVGSANVATFGGFSFGLIGSDATMLISGEIKAGDQQVYSTLDKFGLSTGTIAGTGNITTTGNVSGVNLTGSGIVEGGSYTEGSITGELVKVVSSNYFANGGFNNLNGGLNNTCLGQFAGKFINGGSAQGNSAFGTQALLKVASGQKNTGIGSKALEQNLGNSNTGLGYIAGKFGVNIDNNVFVGSQAGLNATGNNSTIVGANSCESATDRTDCVAVGYLSDVTGVNGIAIGANVTAATNVGVIGDSSITSISNMGNNTCDLGTNSNRYKDAYFGGNGYFGTSVQVSDNWVFNQSATELKLNHLTGGTIDKSVTLMTPDSSSDVAYRKRFGLSTATASVYENSYVRIGYTNYSGVYKLTFQVIAFPTGMTALYCNSSPDYGASQPTSSASVGAVVAMTTLASFATFNSVFNASLVFANVDGESPRYVIGAHRASSYIYFDVRKITEGSV